MGVSPVTFKRTVTTEIEAPVNRVYELISDPDRHREWSGAAPVRPVAAAPPSRFVCECRDDSGTYMWTFDITSSPVGTTLHYTVQRKSASPFLRIVQPLAWEMTGERQVERRLARLKALAEQRTIMLPEQTTAATYVEPRSEAKQD